MKSETKSEKPSSEKADSFVVVRRAVIITLFASAVVLGACNTTEGFGEDVKNLGSNIEETAEDNQ